MMTPQIELYLNTERDWVSESMLEHFCELLNAMVPELLGTLFGQMVRVGAL